MRLCQETPSTSDSVQCKQKYLEDKTLSFLVSLCIPVKYWRWEWSGNEATYAALSSDLLFTRSAVSANILYSIWFVAPFWPIQQVCCFRQFGSIDMSKCAIIIGRKWFRQFRHVIELQFLSAVTKILPNPHNLHVGKTAVTSTKALKQRPYPTLSRDHPVPGRLPVQTLPHTVP